MYNELMKPKLTIGHFPIIDHLILGVAAHNDGGTFAHFNLKTELFRTWEKMASALKTKKIDGTFIIFPLAMELFREGVDLRAVLLGQREGQILILEKSIKSVKDLKGKTILVPHRYSVHNILVHQLLKREGLNPDTDVHFKTSFKDVGELGSAIRQGMAQAVCTTEPWGVISAKSASARVIPISHELKMHHVCCVLVLRAEVIKNNPEACRELIKSLVKAGMFVSAYPRQAAEIGEKFIACPKKFIVESLTHGSGRVLTWDLLPRLEDFSDWQNIAIKEMKLWESPIDLSRFVEPKFAQEAYSEWMVDTRREVKDKGQNRTIPGNFAESVNRMSLLVDNPVCAVGAKIIRPGEKYPKNLKRDSKTKLSLKVLEEVSAGEMIFIQSLSRNNKGVVLSSPSAALEPDAVFLRVNKAQAEKILDVLNFGRKENCEIYKADEIEAKAFGPERVNPVRSSPTSNGVKVFEGKDETWLVLDEKVFRFLPLLLAYF